MASLRLNPSASFSEEDQNAVEKYRFGLFEESTLRRVLVLLEFPLYRPDKGLRKFNTTRFANLTSVNHGTLTQPQHQRPVKEGGCLGQQNLARENLPIDPPVVR